MIIDLNSPIKEWQTSIENDPRWILMKKYGWDGCVLNHAIDFKDLSSYDIKAVKDTKKQLERSGLDWLKQNPHPPSCTLNLKRHIDTQGTIGPFGLVFFTRITISLSEKAQCNKISTLNKIFNVFDLVAIRPTRPDCVHTIQQSLKNFCDIIQFPLDMHRPLFKRKIICGAISHNFFFEIVANDFISNVSTGAKNPKLLGYYLNNLRTLIDFSGGKGLFISLGASEPLLIRSYLDVCNLYLLLIFSSHFVHRFTIADIHFTSTRHFLSQVARKILVRGASKYQPHPVSKAENNPFAKPDSFDDLVTLTGSLDLKTHIPEAKKLKT